MWQETMEFHNSKVTIMGSVHILPKEDENTQAPDWAVQTIKSSDIVLFELALDDIMLLKGRMDNGSIYARATELAGVDSPAIWYNILNRIDSEFVSEFSIGVDFRIMGYCYENNIPMVSLESWESQEDGLVNDQAKLIQFSMGKINQLGIRSISEVSQDFINGFVTALVADKLLQTKPVIELYSETESGEEFYDAMTALAGVDLIDSEMIIRNMTMAKNIQRVALENPNKNILVVVGALHTVGAKSVNNILKGTYGARAIWDK